MDTSAARAKDILISHSQLSRPQFTGTPSNVVFVHGVISDIHLIQACTFRSGSELNAMVDYLALNICFIVAYSDIPCPAR